ncbi:MAG: stalk domain-containing protein [Bacillota bacterium]
MNKRKFLAISMVLLLSISVIAFSDDHIEKIEAYLSDDLNFNVDGEKWEPKDVDGSDLSPILYNDRTYVPVRSLLENKGVTVGYEAETRTVLLDYSTIDIAKPIDKATPLIYDTKMIEGGGAGKATFKELKIEKNPNFDIGSMEMTQEMNFTLSDDIVINVDGRKIDMNIDQLENNLYSWGMNSANLRINQETGNVEKINISSLNSDEAAAADIDIKIEIICCPLEAIITVNF